MFKRIVTLFLVMLMSATLGVYSGVSHAAPTPPPTSNQLPGASLLDIPDGYEPGVAYCDMPSPNGSGCKIVGGLFDDSSKLLPWSQWIKSKVNPSARVVWLSRYNGSVYVTYIYKP